MTNSQLVAILVLLTVVFLVLALHRLLGHRRQADAARARMELHARLLDKIQTSEELRAYLESGAARLIDEAFAPSPAEAYTRILIAAMMGSALTTVGLCLVGVAIALGDPGSRASAWIAGAAVLSLVSGAACLVAAYVAFRLSKAWGLLDRRD